MPDQKEVLHNYLQEQRNAVLLKVGGLSERELRWPRTRTGLNLLGVVKHLACMEIGYLGEVFGKPAEDAFRWFAPDAAPNADFYATAEESAESVMEFYADAIRRADATIGELDLESMGVVPWWHPDKREVTLERVLVHVIAETARHAGQLDILREEADGAVGYRSENDNLPEEDEAWWREYNTMLKGLAEAAG